MKTHRIALAGLLFFHLSWLHAQTACPTVVYPSPDTPVNVTAIASDQAATVSFSTGASQCRYKGASFTIRSGDGSVSVTASASPVQVTGLKNGTSYSFTVQACGGSTQATSCSTSAASNTVSPVVKQEVAVKTGWNLLGNGSVEPLSVYSDFNDSSRVMSVWKWNAANAKWAFFSPLLADGGAAYAASKGYEFLTKIYGGEGYWVNASKAFSVALMPETAVSSTSFLQGKVGELRRGWNMVAVGETSTPSAFNSNIGMTPPSAGSTPLNLTSLWAWDNENAKWLFYAPELEAKGGTALTDFIAGKGYGDFAAFNKKLGPGVGFWVNYPNESAYEGIGATLKSFLAHLSTCDANAKQAIPALFSGSYFEGRPIATWVDQVCSLGFGEILATNQKLIAVANDKAVLMTTLTGQSIPTHETAFGFMKVGNTWKMIAEKIPLAMDDPRLRHELILDLNSNANSPKALYKYQRYIDFWTDRTEYGGTPAASIEIFAIASDELPSRWSTTGFPALPDVTLYQAPNNCSNLYTVEKSPNSCNASAMEASFPALFAKLEANQHTVLLYRYLDANGACLNCDATTGLASAGSVMGKAKTFAEIFGTEVSASQLATSAGLAPAAIPSTVKTNFRRYFGMPTDAQLDSLANVLLSPTVAATVSLPWTKSTKYNSSLEGLWGGTSSCAPNSPWVNLEDADLKPSDSKHDFIFNNPSTKTFSNAGYVSFTFSTEFDLTHFTFRLSASRGNICSQ